MVTIRKATATDCGDVFRLICELEQERLPYPEFSTIFRNQLESRQYSWLVAEVKGTVVGFLNLRCEQQLHHCAVIGEIIEMVVDPNHRDQGIGKALFDRACERAREQGCVQIELGSRKTRTDAHRFYEREGMVNSHYKFTLPLTQAAPDTGE